ncbi:MAG: hypothetical protein IB618_00110 [Candidatus Pacearchaeota archaeon]|nr:MAG: hypothetical protein IB618_00110 [Candidatus Pacearchaeota archaeon]
MEEQNKPSKLDYIMSLTPIPVIGERCAKKVWSYEAEKDSKGDVSGRVFISRYIAYCVIPSMIAGPCALALKIKNLI